jgi:hypothetical protein
LIEWAKSRLFKAGPKGGVKIVIDGKEIQISDGAARG